MALVSISEASRATGISRTQLYRMRDRGFLKGWLIDGKIELDGLREHCLQRIRYRIDSVHQKPEPSPLPWWTAEHDLLLGGINHALAEVRSTAAEQLIEGGCDEEIVREALEGLQRRTFAESCAFVTDCYELAGFLEVERDGEEIEAEEEA